MEMTLAKMQIWAVFLFLFKFKMGRKEAGRQLATSTRYLDQELLTTYVQ